MLNVNINDLLDVYRKIINEIGILLIDVQNSLNKKNMEYNELFEIQVDLAVIESRTDIISDMYEYILETAKHKRFSKKMAKYIEEVSQDIVNNLNITNSNIERRKSMLCKLLNEYSNMEQVQDNLDCFNATEVVISYLCGFDSDLEKADDYTKSVMLRLLQRYLNSDSNDLIELLEAAKVSNGETLKRKLKLPMDY